ncbi:hypothetical protein MAM1_0234d08482 [Mucor ambiguus]|uniref:Nucleoporin Nup159/Nup146 N-terminal domain-containing protein n=1 Tax=Mucor ambiguus TaxID=91626 RepID=A0A0C9MZC4_9FUNG|nr:hypothetical protein MAM1_0234d08482 [Mucor ambiguus]
MSSFDGDEIIDPTDVEFFKFSGLVPDAKVSLQEEPFDTANYPATVSLLACSNKFGQFAAATRQGFIFGLTKALRSTFYSANKGEIKQLSDDDRVSVPLANAIRQIRFSADEKHILIACEGGSLSVYSTDDIQNQKGNVKPVNAFALGYDVADVRPNPEAYGNIAAVLYANQQCALIDFTTGNTECTFPLDNITAICWSFKGKQIVCGKSDGGLQHFDIKGAVKDSLAIPEAMSAGHGDEVENRYVCDVLWIENHIFLAMYARKRKSEEDDYINDGYIINRKPATGTGPVYTRLAEITPIFTTEGRGNHFYMETIRGLGKEIEHLIIIANAATSEISVVGHDEHGVWATWQLPENGLANLPLSPTTSLDTFPVGLALDLTADEKLPAFDPSEKDVGVEPMPVFYYLNDDGEIGSFHCYNSELARRGESFKNESSTTAPTAPPATAIAATTPAPSGFSAFGTASTSNNDNAFANLLSGKSAMPAATSSSSGSGFGGFGGFGSAAGGSIPSFSNLGSAPKISASPAFGTSNGFGSATASTATKETSKPLFGSTTSFGAATKNETPAFGSTSSFGASANKTATASFGSTSSLGTATAQPAPTSFFGSSSSFGSAKSTASPFSTSTTSSFGAPAQKPAPATAAATTTTTTTTIPKTEPDVASLSFGALSTNDEKKTEAPKPATATTTTTTTTPMTTSAFGSTGTLTSGGFGSLAKNTVPGAKSPSTTIPSSLFSQSATPAAATPSATTTTTSSSLFGSTSTMKAPAAATPLATSAFGSTSTLGSGGFGSLAKNTVPGAKSPAAAPPTFGTSTSFGAPASAKTSTTPSTISTPSAPVTITPSATAAAPTSKPAVVTVPATTITAEPKKPAEPTTSKPPTEKLKPTAEEGMARGYEELYIKVTEEIEMLKEHHSKLTLAVTANTMPLEAKSVSNLQAKEVSWNLSDAQQLGNIAHALNADIKNEEATLQQTKQQVNALIQNCKKSMDKKEDIKYLLGKEFDSKVVDILDNRELDVETKKAFIELQSKSKACGSILTDLEFKTEESEKRNRIRNAQNAGSLSMYTLRRAIRDIEREIVHKEDTLTELGDQLAAIKLRDSRIKARRGAIGISCDDLSDSEQEEDAQDSRIKPAVIEHTTRYLRRYLFLDTVFDEITKSGPVYTSIE